MAGHGRKPHIVLILANQLRADVLGAFGDQQCPTPRIDLLSQHATAFRRHYTPCPLGIPARATLATGLSPLRHGARINGSARTGGRHATIHDDAPLLHERLIDAGYRVVHVGILNLHTQPALPQRVPSAEFLGPLSLPEHLQQLEQRGLTYGNLDALRDPVLDYIEAKPVVLGGWSGRSIEFPLRAEFFYDRVIAENAARVLREYAAGSDDKPLALLCNFNVPHPPMWAPQDYAELIRPEDVRLPATTGRWYASTSPMHLAHFTGQMGARLELDQWRKTWAMYLGMTALLDECVGQVLAEMDRTGILTDAVIAMSSDHGDMLGARRLLGKMCMYEPAVRVPLIIKPPGTLAESRHRHTWELTTHADLCATLLDYADAQPMPASQGLSLRAIAEGRADTAPPRQYLFASFDGNAGLAFTQRMVRTKSHKLIHNIGYDAEFYDLIEDPRETRNLYGDPNHAAIRESLRQRLNLWMQSQGDDAPPL